MVSASAVVGVTWFLAALCGLAMVARSIIKMRAIRHFGADDVFIWAAFLFFIGACATAQLQVRYGLGQSSKSLPLQTQYSELKSSYAKYLLYEPIIALSKLSVVSVLRKCALNRKDRLLLYIFEWFLVVWAITAELVWAFSCQMPEPWNHNGQCINRRAWASVFETMNSVTELALIIIPTVSISQIPVPRRDKIIASSFFWARIVIIPASILRIWYNVSESGSTLSDTPFVIATMVVAALEILAACVIYARPLFRILESGCFTIAARRSSLSQAPGAILFDPSYKGSWPLTHIPSVEDKHNSGYLAQVLANGQSVDKQNAEHAEDIRVQQHFNVLSSNTQRVYIDDTYPRVEPPADFIGRESDMIPLEPFKARYSAPPQSDPLPWQDKDLPSPPPSHQKTSFLFA